MQVQKKYRVSLIYFMKGVLKMNKNEQTATMYETIPAVAELNKVPGFNPLKLLRRIISPDNGETVLQLDLPYKKLWFRLANPRGRIRLNALRITEQMAIYEAQIFLDRTDENPIGSFTSSCTKEEAPGGQYIQAAQQAAMDEALSDAGFGIQFADVNLGTGGSRYGSRVSLSGGSQTQKTEIPAGVAVSPARTPQQTTAPAGGSVRTFPASAGKTGTSPQNKTAQASGLPVQGEKVAVNAKAEERKPMDQNLAQNTGTEPKAPLEVVAESGNPAMSMPAGTQGDSESLPVNPGSHLGHLPVQSGAEQKTKEQSLASTQRQPGQPSVVSIQAGGDTKPAQTVQAQETVQSAGTGELPVKAAEPESLPVQTNEETCAAEKTGNVLPVSEKKNEEEDTQKAVQGMMALLGGHDVSAETVASSAGNAGSGGSAKKAEASGPAPEVQGLPVTGGLPQEKTNARYTPDMPVEEIVKLMTFEEAGKVVVDTGVCKGQTIAEVAERRPPSLKFYLYGGYRGDNNILRAAAQIMLDSLAAKKAG